MSSMPSELSVLDKSNLFVTDYFQNFVTIQEFGYTLFSKKNLDRIQSNDTRR